MYSIYRIRWLGGRLETQSSSSLLGMYTQIYSSLCNILNHIMLRIRRRGAAEISLVATTDHLYSDTLDLRSFTCRWRTETYAHTTFIRGQVRICSSATRLHSRTLPLSYLILPPFLRYPFFTKIFCWLMSWHGTIKSFVLKLKPWLPSCLDKITPARPTKTTVDNVATFYDILGLFTIHLNGVCIIRPSGRCWW